MQKRLRKRLKAGWNATVVTAFIGGHILLLASWIVWLREGEAALALASVLAYIWLWAYIANQD